MKTFLIILFTSIIVTSFGQGIINNGQIVCSGAINIVVNDNANWTDNGTFTSDNSDIIFIGSSNQTINGTSNTSFNKLTLNKTSGDLLLETNIYVTDSLYLTNGDLDLKNSTLDLQSTGVISSETENNKIKVGDPTTNIGEIKYTRTINNVTDFDPANLGISITTTENLGSITVARGHKRLQGTGTFTSNYSVARYYNVPGIGELDGTNITLKMHYWDSELGTDYPAESDLIMYQKVNQSTDEFWTNLSTNVDEITNTITINANPYNTYIYGAAYSDIIFNDIFTLGSGNNPLPIGLLYFSAEKLNTNAVKLNWETSVEINNNFFIIEKTTDNINWEFVSKIKGAGNSNIITNYIEYDYSPYEGLSYYRLKQVDYDGNFTFSNIKPIFIENDIENIILYPNPTNSIVNISGNNVVKIEILNTYGKLINTITNNVNQIDLSNYAKGTYFIKLITNENIYLKKLILN